MNTVYSKGTGEMKRKNGMIHKGSACTSPKMLA